MGAAAVLGGHTRSEFAKELGSRNDVDRLPGSFLKHALGMDTITFAEGGDGAQHRRQYTTLRTPGHGNLNGEQRDMKD